MNAANELRMLESEIHELEKAIEANARMTRRQSQASMGIGIAIVVVIACFALVNFLHLRREFTREKLTESFSREIASMSPVAMEELQQLGQHLLPVYGQALTEQVERSWPAISETLQTEAENLTGGLLNRAHDLMADSQQRILRNTEEQVLHSYPGLASAQGTEELTRKIDSICQGAATKSLSNFDALYSRDVDRVQEALLRFDVSDSKESPTDLQKKFIHLWLQLLDQEITEL